MQNQAVEAVDLTEAAGIGVRALIGSSWGFYATSDMTDQAARSAGAMAASIATASASVPGPAMDLADVEISEAFYETPHEIDPFTVSLSEKVDLLVAVTKTLQDVKGIAIARGSLNFWDTNKWFVSSQGHRIHQHLIESGGGYDATALGEAETQRRSYPQSFGQYETGGWETVTKWDYLGNAQRVPARRSSRRAFFSCCFSRFFCSRCRFANVCWFFLAIDYQLPLRCPPPRSLFARASFTFSVRPSSSLPLSASIAARAAESSGIVTNAKPRGRPVSRSVMTATSSTSPCSANALRSVSSVVSKLRLPT